MAPKAFSPGIGPVMPAGFAGAPRTSFYTVEGIVAVADITWSEPAATGGNHTVDWRLFRHDEMLRAKRTNEQFFGKPARVLSHISADSFPPGQYRIELLVDQKPFALLPFSILATQTPAPFAGAIASPDCTVTGLKLMKIKPLSLIRPQLPKRAEDRLEGGCAVVSVVLDNDGHPSGVRVDAEYPANSGFGKAVADAAFAAIYPANHGGETTYMTVRFNFVR